MLRPSTREATNSIQNYVINGWSIAPIVTFYTGRPYDGVVSGTTLNGTLGDQRFPLNPRNAFRLPNILNVIFVCRSVQVYRTV